MKRHDALVPLSHHHHHALARALELKRVGTEQSMETPQEVVQKLRTFWENGGNAHFREEEEILWPAYAQHADVDREDIKENLLEHVKIRALVAEVIGSGEPPIERMRELGELLEAHVRKEERQLFQMIQDTLPEDKLMELKPYFHANFDGGGS